MQNRKITGFVTSERSLFKVDPVFFTSMSLRVGSATIVERSLIPSFFSFADVEEHALITASTRVKSRAFFCGVFGFCRFGNKNSSSSVRDGCPKCSFALFKAFCRFSACSVVNEDTNEDDPRFDFTL